jgi:hypothetical protein
MHHWSFTLHGPGGILSTLESGETQFVLGTEQAADVWTIAGEGVAARHALVRVVAGRVCAQVSSSWENTFETDSGKIVRQSVDLKKRSNR